MRASTIALSGSAGYFGRVAKKVSVNYESQGGDVIEQYAYDKYGNVTAIQDANGGVQFIEYDLDMKTYQISNTNEAGYKNFYEYDEYYRLVREIDVNGKTYIYSYDAFGRLVSEQTVLDTETDPFRKVFYSYESIKTQTKDSAPGDPATYFETYEYFDGLGRTIQTKVESDVYGEWITQDFYYDYAGRNWKTSVKYITYTSDFTTRDTAKPNTYNEYDALGRIVRSYNPDSTFKQMIYDLNTTWTIDENGHAVSVTVEGNKTITKQYTGTAVVNGKMVSGVTEYAVTETITAANGTRIIDHDGNVIETEIDMLGRTIRYSDPDKGEYFYSYDANGNLISQTNGKGEVLTFTYDPLNRILEKSKRVSMGSKKVYRYVPGQGMVAIKEPIFANSPLAIYSYGTDPAKNEVGRLVSVTTRDLGTDTYTYDDFGQLDKYTRTLLGVSASIDYDYDCLGRVVQYTLPNGEVVTNEYGSGGNVYSINGTNTLEGFENYSYVLDARYLASGQMQGFELGNGVRTSYDYYDTSSEYDPYTGLSYSHRLRNIFIQASDGTILADTTYQYDYLDNIMVKAYSGSFGNSSYTELYQYDDLNRLISWTSNVLDPETDVTKTWAYDEINNMISNNGTLYTYDPNRPHAVNNAGGVTYQYDANGNMISKDGYRTLEYNSEERLVSMSDGGTYVYDVSGQRAVKDEGGITTYYFFPEFEWHTDGAVSGYISYVFMNGERIAKREQKGADESDLYYFHKDHLDSSVGMTDDAGLIVFAAAYAPFGQEIFSAGTIIPKFTFTDQEIEANGIMYYNARYYDPALSRFLQADPVLDGLNRYAYVGNNPVKYVDPSGLYRIYMGGGYSFDTETEETMITTDNYDAEKKTYDSSLVVYDKEGQHAYGEHLSAWSTEEGKWQQHKYIGEYYSNNNYMAGYYGSYYLDSDGNYAFQSYAMLDTGAIQPTHDVFGLLVGAKLSKSLLRLVGVNFNSGLTPDKIYLNPSSISNKSLEQIARIFRRSGYRTEIRPQNSGHGFKLIIDGHRINYIQNSTAASRHGLAYLKIRGDGIKVNIVYGRPDQWMGGIPKGVEMIFKY
jgi:RHS repeat-associated protein